MIKRQKPGKTNVLKVLDWFGLPVALLGGAAVAGGLFEEPSFATDSGSILAVAVLVYLCCLLQVAKRAKGAAIAGADAFVGPVLWTVGLWMAARPLMALDPHALFLPMAFVAWLVVSAPMQYFVMPLALIVAMEGGLSFFGYQSLAQAGLNLASCGAAALALGFFMSSKVYRRRMRKVMTRAKRDADSREYARDLGLFANPPEILSSLPQYDPLEDPEAGSQPAVETITAAFDVQLELIRQTLDLTSVALLWPDPEGSVLRLRSIATLRHDIDPGPYGVGTGITGALMGATELVSVAPVTSSFGGLPYYRSQRGVGGLLALRIQDGDKEWLGFDGKKIAPILCMDREDTAPWSETERETINLVARKLAQDVKIGRQYQTMAQERSAIHRVCIALRELNAVLGLEQVLQATVKAVRILVRADFVSISLVRNDRHRIAWAEGDDADALIGREFGREEGLVGQVLKINRPLPAKAECHGPTQVFGNEHRLKGYSSLLVLPLQKEEGEAIGALVVAVKEPHAFTRSRQEILELIAAQVAVKVDLGQAHEQINRMATTDGLTGLINHRTFQHGFDVMLQREQRRSGSLSVILCDIDHFKKVNDTYGHPFGDEVLKGVAKVLKNAGRATDLAARYGGEEFALVLEDSNAKGARQMAERVRQEVERLSFRHKGEEVRVTMSLGVAVLPQHGEEKAELISRADQALYQAKQQGRNRVVVWDKD